ncbi:MAG: HpcH/HpaI aldolase family protein [Christensenellales bacterium]|jgi:2-keto-3-deoxy-L-rhamnonate aldolase RhmA
MNLKNRLKDGQSAVGLMLSEIYTPNITRLLGGIGFDFLILDCEHGYFDLTQVANLVAVAKGCHLPIIVRAPQEASGNVGKYLDLGAAGILLANVTCAEQARRHVAQCLYAPQGNRGVSTFRAHTGYKNGEVTDMLRQANKSNIVVVQVESPEAITAVEDILAVEGLDGVLVGPNDLTQQMGILGQYEHPDVQEAIRRVAVAAAACGKWSGIITGNEKLARYCHSLGMSFFSVGSELSLLAKSAGKLLDDVSAIFGKKDDGR